MRAQIIKPDSPQQRVEHENTVFLAGSIEMGLAEDWQKLAEEALQDSAVTIFNPRRDDWDSSWEQRARNPQFSQQVNWEMDKLQEADCEEYVDDIPGPVVEFRVKSGRVTMKQPRSVLQRPSHGDESHFMKVFMRGGERGCTIEQFKKAVEMCRAKFKVSEEAASC